jgi:hypothetical protein
MRTITALTVLTASTVCALVMPAAATLAQPAKNQTYAWSGEVIMLNSCLLTRRRGG